MFKRPVSKISGFYFTIGIRDCKLSGYGREFYILELKANNPLRYIHEIRGFVFSEIDDCENFIIEKLGNEHGFYHTLSGGKVIGIKAYRYKLNED
jgi:hypothetical protein